MPKYHVFDKNSTQREREREREREKESKKHKARKETGGNQNNLVHLVHDVTTPEDETVRTIKAACGERRRIIAFKLSCSLL